MKQNKEVRMIKVKKIDSLPKAEFTRSTKLKKNRQKRSDFQEMLDAYMSETAEDLETYSLYLPKHGSFWDDGYRDVRVISNRS